ncbi:MAG TPA: hypothetical protein VL527_09460 [Dongiaceae bacterium]|nr:hypothetical protein [Dongiaceae bacterium]
MHMIKDQVSGISGVELYGIISICLFVAVFTGALVWALRLKKPFLNSMSTLPLSDEETATAKKGISHEE